MFHLLGKDADVLELYVAHNYTCVCITPPPPLQSLDILYT